MMKMKLQKIVVLGLIVSLTGLISTLAAADTELETTVVTNDTVNTTTNIHNGNSSVRVWMNGMEWSGLPRYVSSREGSWSSDREGMEEEDMTEIFGRIARKEAGKKPRSFGRVEKSIASSLFFISDSRCKKQSQEIVSQLNAIGGQVKQNQYETEALGVLMQGLHPDKYCQAKMTVMNRHNLTSVDCGQKTCYNGDMSDIYNGKDYCVKAS